MPFKRFLSFALGPLPSALLACAGIVTSQAGCDVNVHDGKASLHLFSAEAKDEWTHRYPLAAGGRVEIVNINGPISVAAGPAGSVEVHATISAKALTDAGAKEILSKGSIQETKEPAHVRVETMSPRAMHGSYEVRYEVRVPADAQTEISITNGPLKADGLTGRFKATRSGNIFPLIGCCASACASSHSGCCARGTRWERRRAPRASRSR